MNERLLKNIIKVNFGKGLQVLNLIDNETEKRVRLIEEALNEDLNKKLENVNALRKYSAKLSNDYANICGYEVEKLKYNGDTLDRKNDSVNQMRYSIHEFYGINTTQEQIRNTTFIANDERNQHLVDELLVRKIEIESIPNFKHNKNLFKQYKAINDDIKALCSNQYAEYKFKVTRQYFNLNHVNYNKEYIKALLKSFMSIKDNQQMIDLFCDVKQAIQVTSFSNGERNALIKYMKGVSLNGNDTKAFNRAVDKLCQSLSCNVWKMKVINKVIL